jgi:hypothetical protein
LPVHIHRWIPFPDQADTRFGSYFGLYFSKNTGTLSKLVLGQESDRSITDTSYRDSMSWRQRSIAPDGSRGAEGA